MAILMSCGENPAFQYDKKIVDTWNYENKINFTLPAIDTSSLNELYIIIQYKRDYLFQNIYLLIDTELPSGRRDQQLININLADQIGNWLGDCSRKSCTYRGLLRDPFSFSEIGNYQISIGQHTRMGDLSGIENIRVELYQVE